MKTTTTKSSTELEMDTLSKRDLMLIKTTIAVFGLVLNICIIQLFNY
jgi:hypothetical protein